MISYEPTVDVVFSARIPPNPSELIMNFRIKELLDEVVNEYGCKIVDTALLMVVTDTLLICGYVK